MKSGAKTNLTRLCGRALKGERVHASAPLRPLDTTTMISSSGWTARRLMALEGTTDTESFRAYVSEVLRPTLGWATSSSWTNLSPHKSDPTLALITTAGAQVLSCQPTRRISIPLKRCGAKSKVCCGERRHGPRRT